MQASPLRPLQLVMWTGLALGFLVPQTETREGRKLIKVTRGSEKALYATSKGYSPGPLPLQLALETSRKEIHRPRRKRRPSHPYKHYQSKTRRYRRPPPPRKYLEEPPFYDKGRYRDEESDYSAERPTRARWNSNKLYSATIRERRKRPGLQAWKEDREEDRESPYESVRQSVRLAAWEGGDRGKFGAWKEDSDPPEAVRQQVMYPVWTDETRSPMETWPEAAYMQYPGQRVSQSFKAKKKGINQDLETHVIRPDKHRLGIGQQKEESPWRQEYLGKQKEETPWGQKYLGKQKEDTPWGQEYLGKQKEGTPWGQEYLGKQKEDTPWVQEYLDKQKEDTPWGQEYLDKQKEDTPWGKEYLGKQKEQASSSSQKYHSWSGPDSFYHDRSYSDRRADSTRHISSSFRLDTQLTS